MDDIYKAAVSASLWGCCFGVLKGLGGFYSRLLKAVTELIQWRSANKK